MDIISEQVYLPSYRRRRSPRKTAALLVGCASLLYVLEARKGVLSSAWKSFSRGLAAAVAAWIEDQSGTALFTLEGNEPPEPDPQTFFGRRNQAHSSPQSTSNAINSGSGASLPAIGSSGTSSAREGTKDLDVPQFLMSTKFFACLELEDSRKVAEAATTVHIPPHRILFEAGDGGDAGIYVVVEGSVGMFLSDGDQLIQTNSLQPGESVGDLDVLDGACRSITCMALEDGAVLVQLSRPLFLAFLASRPNALQIYLQQGVARLWRVAKFILSDYLNLPMPLSAPPSGIASQQHAEQLQRTSETSPTRRGMLRATASDGADVAALEPALSANSDSARWTDPALPQEQASPGGSAAATRATGSMATGVKVEASGCSPEDSRASRHEDSSGRAEAHGLGHSASPAQATRAATGERSVGAHATQALDCPGVDTDTLEVLNRVLQSSSCGGTAGEGHDWKSMSNSGDGEGPPRSSDVTDAGGMVYVRKSKGSKGALRPLQQLQHTPVPACAVAGWDCVNASEAKLGQATVAMLQQHSRTFVTTVLPSFKIHTLCRSITLVPGSVLLQRGKAAGQVMLIVDGQVTLERVAVGTTQQSATAGPGSLLGAAAFLCSTSNLDTVKALTTCTALAIGAGELHNILETSQAAYLDILFAGSKALGYCIRRFVSLGLNRVWTRSGDVVYQQGVPADSMYVLISGRVRLVSQHGSKGAVHVDEEVGRGQAIGAIWAVTNRKHDTSAIAVRDSEIVRLSKESFEVISRAAPEAAAIVLSQMADRLLHARRSRSSFKSLRRVFSPAGPRRTGAAQAGSAAPAQKVTQRMGEIVTIAIVPAGTPPQQRGGPRTASAVRRLSGVLKESLAGSEGPTLTLTWTTMKVLFPQVCHRLQVPFYRTKVTSWMASQEEDYRFILLEADPGEDRGWAQLCVEQADCILLVAPENASPDVTAPEYETVWRLLMPPDPPGTPRVSSTGSRRPSGQDVNSKMSSLDAATLGGVDTASGACFTADSDEDSAPPEPISKHDWLRFARRVELVMLHGVKCKAPSGTLAWLQQRPLLTRHHHVRLGNCADVARLCRWMAGKAIGLVLSGGGSRGLAHLGVLQALDDLGVPVDVVGGTSQGAFMAALYAQGLTREQLLTRVRSYATAMSSPRHLLSDVTLPILSLFSGKLFDRVLQETFAAGPQEIEDLWLPFFCVSTNLSRAQVQVHQLGRLWQFVRASMTIVGMIPPVFSNGDMLVDGGYLNNQPVDVMHSLGVQTVMVVDVEDKQSGAWHTLTPYDGGLSGWRLLWDRLCPVPSLRFGKAAPRYRELVNALSWIAHSQNLRRMCQDYRVDLYLRPPHIAAFKLMDYHLIDRIVRTSYRYAWAALTEWLERRQPALRARKSLQAELSSEPPGRAVSMFEAGKHWRSMAQLQPQQPTLPLQREDGRPAEVSGAWLVQRAAKSQTVPEAQPLVPKAATAAVVAGGGGVDQNSSLESLTDQSVLPSPGEKVRYKQSELMRLTAHRLASVAAASQQPGQQPTAAVTAETASAAGPSVVQLSSLFFTNPRQLQSPGKPAGEDGSVAVPQSAVGAGGGAAAVDVEGAATGAAVWAGHVDVPDAQLDVAGTGGDCVGPEDVEYVARAFSAPLQSSAEVDHAPHDSAAEDQVPAGKMADPSEPGQLLPEADDLAWPVSAADMGPTEAAEISNAGSSGSWKAPDGTISHKRRSSRTVPGLLQTIAEADQEDSV